ncbi:hypothetical protein Back11_56930 [Paenibacillus baekrokdamisoli]|uniref:Uncharacterized protein n=1 Tax=Paenibacillus baekrokdamisoli TaxID=1712516 RepID=A0A3G9JJS4_9BACL|nr:hypothetical protein [Paenibacillus baekrokdamisoli]MBB3073430.1 hypothetical protein [Paenibacillus baekrokdamisoli]BBH24348.1 hypothetical protein Back11_56930 [Paenibacillus baekrokdamisoli]
MEKGNSVARINTLVREIILKHIGNSFIGLIVQGSAIKGGFIQGSSDIDYILYMDDSALNEAMRLPSELCIAIHKDLSLIEVWPFRYIQFSVLSPKTNKYLGPIRGTYQLLAGHLLVSEATNDQIYQDAVESLDKLIPAAAFDTHQLLDHGEDRIERCTRLMCTIVWPIAFQLLTVIHKDGTRIWGLKKQDSVTLLSSIPSVADEITSFYHSIQSYYPLEQSSEKALKVIKDGISFIYAAKQHWISLQS